MISTTKRHWPFPSKTDSLTDSYDIFSHLLGDIDNEFGGTITQIYGTKITYFWDTIAERDATVNPQVGEAGLLTQDSSLYLYESDGTWRKVITYSALPVVFANDPSYSDYKYNLGQIWVNEISGEVFYITNNAQFDAIWKSFNGRVIGKNVSYGMFQIDMPIMGAKFVNTKFNYITNADGQFYFRYDVSNVMWLDNFKCGTFVPAADRQEYFLAYDIEELKDNLGNIDENAKIRLSHMLNLILKDDKTRYVFEKDYTIIAIQNWYKQNYGYVNTIDLTIIAKDEQKYNEFVSNVKALKVGYQNIIEDKNDFIYTYNERMLVNFKLLPYKDATHTSDINIKDLLLKMPKSYTCPTFTTLTIDEALIPAPVINQSLSTGDSFETNLFVDDSCGTVLSTYSSNMKISIQFIGEDSTAYEDFNVKVFLYRFDDSYWIDPETINSTSGWYSKTVDSTLYNKILIFFDNPINHKYKVKIKSEVA